VEKEGRAGGQEQNALLLPPDPGMGREAGRPWPTALGSGLKQGKTEVETTATYPFPHLGRGRPVKMAPRRRAAADNGGWGGGARRLEEEGGRWLGGAGCNGKRRRLFIGGKRWFGGQISFW
jgi:hypothetical protein